MRYLPEILIILAPTYLVRFSFLGAPLNLFMVVLAVAIVMLGFEVYRSSDLKDFMSFAWLKPRRFLYAVALFGLSGCISVFVDGVSAEKIAWFVVIFFQPMLLFLLFSYIRLKKKIEYDTQLLLYFIALCGVLAAIQYHTLWFLDPKYWGNSLEPKRATAFWEQANMYALFATPVLAYVIPKIYRALKEKKWLIPLCWLLGVVGVFYSQSRGAWLALAVSVVVFGLYSLTKKQLVVLGALGVVLFGVFWTTNFRYRLITPFYGEQSTGERPQLWSLGKNMLIDRPVLGQGLKGFGNKFDEYNHNPQLLHYNSPHNIFLNFWIDTGLLGLISFLLICVRFFKKKSYLPQLLFLITILVHGIIDTPYLKNDLAAVFWILLSLQ